MKQGPMVFFGGGTLFGFVLGYMIAGLAERPEAREVPTPAVSSGEAASGGGGGPVPAPGTQPLDPSELSALRSLADKDKSNAKVRVELGNLLMDHARFDEAAGWYRQALSLEPDNVDVGVDLGACLVSGGKPGEGLQAFEGALKKNPNHKKALYNKGIALMALGHQQDALSLWEDLLKRFPDDPQLRGLRTQIEQVRGSMGKT